VSSPPAPLPFEELQERVSRIRGLSFQHKISLETKTVEELRAILERSFSQEQTSRELEQIGRVFKRLGLIPEATELPKALIELRLFQEAAYYDSQSKKIILPRDPLGLRLGFLRFPGSIAEDFASQLLMIHALTHALQDQHFQWQDRLRRRNTLDLGLALRALTRGDAVLMGLAYLAGEAGEKKENIRDGIKTLKRLATQVDRELSHLPELLRELAAFQYLEGSEFVLWAHSLKGWEGVNTLFSQPPASTEQILHPEKYYAKRENPVWITPWSLIRQFGKKKTMEDTLGEFLIRFLLSRSLSKEEAERAASGWAGDALFTFEHKGELVLAWITAWDDEKEALEFYQSYQRALEKRHGVALEAAAERQDTLTAPAHTGHSLLLQIKGNLVFFLDGMAAPRAQEIAGDLWDEIETGSEPVPLELTHRRSHRSQRTR